MRIRQKGLLLLMAIAATVALLARPGLLTASPGSAPLSALPPLGQGLELTGHLGGTMRAVAVAGSHALLGVGPRLAVLDVSSPPQPRFLGQSAVLHGIIRDIAVRDNLAYVVTQNASLHILDISDPSTVREVGLAPVKGNPQRIVLAGGFAYVAAEGAGLHVFNVEAADRPVLTAVVQTRGQATDIAIAANHAYVADGAGGVTVFDISQPQPVEVGRRTLVGGVVRLEARGTWLYVIDSGRADPSTRGTGDARLTVLDASDPRNPVEAGTIVTGGGVESFALAGDVALVAVNWWNGAGLRVIRITDPANPVLVNNLLHRWTGALDTALMGGYALIAEESGILRVLALNGEEIPAEVASYSNGGPVHNTTVHGERAYVVDQQGAVRIMDVREPRNVRELGTMTFPGSGNGISPDVAVNDVTAYVVNDSGLHIMNAYDAAHPVTLGFVELPNSQGVAVAGQRAYVANGSLNIIDVHNPSDPHMLGSFSEAPVSMNEVTVRGAVSYVLDFLAGLRVVDVSDPANPVRTGWASFNGGRALALHGDRAYVANVGYRTLESGISIVNIADPDSPTVVKFLQLPGRTFDVALGDGRLYGAAYDAGVRMFDLSAPDNPVEIGYFNVPGGAVGVTFAGGMVYAYGNGGVFILRPAPVMPHPELTAPANGSMLHAITAELTWRKPAGTTQVEVRVLPFNNDGPGVDLILGAGQDGLSLPAPQFGTGPYVLLPDMTYTWAVRSSTATAPLKVDSPEWGPWSPPATFRTPTVSAAAISPVSPAAGAAEVGRMPLLQWRDIRTDVFYYEVQVSRDPLFTTEPETAIAAVYWNLVHGGVTQPLNSWRVPDTYPLDSGITYYWRIRPRIQGDGVPVAWSPAWSFMTAR